LVKKKKTNSVLDIIFYLKMYFNVQPRQKIAPMCWQFFFLLQNGHFLQYFKSVCKGK